MLLSPPCLPPPPPTATPVGPVLIPDTKCIGHFSRFCSLRASRRRLRRGFMQGRWAVYSGEEETLKKEGGKGVVTVVVVSASVCGTCTSICAFVCGERDRARLRLAHKLHGAATDVSLLPPPPSPSLSYRVVRQDKSHLICSGKCAFDRPLHFKISTYVHRARRQGSRPA